MRAQPSPLVLGERDKRLETSGFALTETFRAPGLILPSHFHEHANIALTVAGYFTETVGPEPYEVNPSSVIFRPAGERHSNRYGKTEAHCLIIEVGAQRLASIREVTQVLDRASYVEAEQVSSLALRLFRELRMRDAVVPLAIEALVLETLVNVTRLNSKAAKNPPQWLRRAREVLHEQFAESISLSSIAALVGVHAVHLAKMFRRCYGCTVGDYVRRLRLDSAANLLAQSDKTLSAIAIGAGFYDQSHFSRLFKLHFGVTPGRFRGGIRKQQVLIEADKQDVAPRLSPYNRAKIFQDRGSRVLSNTTSEG